MSDVLAELSAAGVAVWLDDLSRERLATGNLAALIQRPARRRRDHQPDDLRQGAGRRATPTTSRSATSRCAGSTSRRRSGRSPRYDVRWACDVLRPAYDASDGRRRPGVDRGRPAARPRHRTRRSPRPRRCGGWSTGPTCSSRSRRPRGPAGDHRDPRRGHQRQRHADLLPRPLRRGDGRLPGRAGAGEGGRHDLSEIASVASFFVSRVDTEVDKRLDKIGTRRGQGAARQGGDRQRPARLPALRAGSSPRTAGRRWPAAGAKPQRPLWASTGVKDPAYPTPCTSWSWSPRARSTPCRRRRSTRSPTTAKLQGDTVTRQLRARPRPSLDALAASASTTTTSCRPSRTRAWRSSTTRGRSLLDTVDSAAEGGREVSAAGTASSLDGSADAAARPCAAEAVGRRQGRQRGCSRPGPDAVGPGRRAPRRRSGSAGSTLPVAPGSCSPSSARCGPSWRRRRRPRRARRHGRLVAGARGDHPDRRRRPRRPRHHRPRPGPGRAGRPLDRTVVVVSSKSGATVETDSHRRAYAGASPTPASTPRPAGIRRRHRPGLAAGDDSAANAGYRDVFLADPNVGGRYCALTAFGLVPTGLAGVDVGRAARPGRRGWPRRSAGAEDNPGLALGAALGAAHAAGRDKVVLVDDGTGITGLGATGPSS